MSAHFFRQFLAQKANFVSVPVATEHRDCRLARGSAYSMFRCYYGDKTVGRKVCPSFCFLAMEEARQVPNGNFLIFSPLN